MNASEALLAKIMSGSRKNSYLRYEATPIDDIPEDSALWEFVKGAQSKVDACCAIVALALNVMVTAEQTTLLLSKRIIEKMLEENGFNRKTINSELYRRIQNSLLNIGEWVTAPAKTGGGYSAGRYELTDPHLISMFKAYLGAELLAENNAAYIKMLSEANEPKAAAMSSKVKSNEVSAAVQPTKAPVQPPKTFKSAAQAFTHAQTRTVQAERNPDSPYSKVSQEYLNKYEDPNSYSID